MSISNIAFHPTVHLNVWFFIQINDLQQVVLGRKAGLFGHPYMMRFNDHKHWLRGVHHTFSMSQRNEGGQRAGIRQVDLWRVTQILVLLCLSVL